MSPLIAAPNFSNYEKKNQNSITLSLHMIEDNSKTTGMVLSRPFQWHQIHVGQTDSFFPKTKSKISFSVTKLKFLINICGY